MKGKREKVKGGINNKRGQRKARPGSATMAEATSILIGSALFALCRLCPVTGACLRATLVFPWLHGARLSRGKAQAEAVEAVPV